jgi:hypothetical protein
MTVDASLKSVAGVGGGCFGIIRGCGIRASAKEFG